MGLSYNVASRERKTKNHGDLKSEMKSPMGGPLIIPIIDLWLLSLLSLTFSPSNLHITLLSTIHTM